MDEMEWTDTELIEFIEKKLKSEQKLLLAALARDGKMTPQQAALSMKDVFKKGASIYLNESRVDEINARRVGYAKGAIRNMCTNKGKEDIIDRRGYGNNWTLEIRPRYRETIRGYFGV